MREIADAASVVYFVRMGKHVKIGFTTNLEKRMKAFAPTTADLALLLVLPGTRDLEAMLHRLFREAHFKNELFWPDKVLNFIDVYKYAGLDRAIQHLTDTTPAARARAIEENRLQRVAARRQPKAEIDARCAALVAERKRTKGW